MSNPRQNGALFHSSSSTVGARPPYEKRPASALNGRRERSVREGRISCRRRQHAPLQLSAMQRDGATDGLRSLSELERLRTCQRCRHCLKGSGIQEALRLCPGTVDRFSGAKVRVALNKDGDASRGAAPSQRPHRTRDVQKVRRESTYEDLTIGRVTQSGLTI